MNIQPVITHASKSWAIAALCIATMSGCGVNPDTLVALTDAAQAVSRSGGATQDLPGLSQPTEVAFEPEYPERVDPFSFPDSAPIADEASTTITSVAQIGVLGFAEVDEPRVFLKTKDLTKSMKVGDVTDGVEVVAIHPPSVELRMGTLVWTASMFDNTVVSQD